MPSSGEITPSHGGRLWVRLKSGQDLRNPGEGCRQFDARAKNFIHSKPWDQRAMYGEATERMKALAQYDVHIEVGAGNALSPDFDFATNRSYTARHEVL